jgi:hypothetical protein
VSEVVTGHGRPLHTHTQGINNLILSSPNINQPDVKKLCCDFSCINQNNPVDGIDIEPNMLHNNAAIRSNEIATTTQ